jgi:hypothetical protein
MDSGERLVVIFKIAELLMDLVGYLIVFVVVPTLAIWIVYNIWKNKKKGNGNA